VLGIPLLRHLKPIGSDPNLTEIKLGIVREGYEKAAFATLVAYIKAACRRWHLVNLPAVPAEVADAGDRPPVEHPAAPVLEGFLIPLAANWDDFYGALKRNAKNDLRKCHNSLKRDGIEPVFSCLSDPAAIQKALPDFYRLHGERAMERNAIRHPNYFESQEGRSLLELLAKDPDNSGMRLFVLKDGDRLIAARLGFETPRGVYLYYSGYEPEYSKYSIMTRLVVEVIKRSIERGQHYVHLSFGRDRSKMRWSPQEVAHNQYLMVSTSLRGRFLAACYIAILKRRKKRFDLERAAGPESQLASESAS